MEEAFRRFMPGVTDIAGRTMLYSNIEGVKAGIVEGDFETSAEGLVLTKELVPAFKNAPLGALFVTGSLLAPKATLTEPDIDWSPLLKIMGSVAAKNLCLGGSASEIDGDLTVEGVLLGYYNHGQMRVRGKTRAAVIIASDYEFVFEGEVQRKYVISWNGRINLPADYEDDRLHLILTPEVLTETNFIKDGAILDRLKRGLPILRLEGDIGTPPPPKLSEKGAARLAELRAKKASGEPVERADFSKCELRFIPDELKEFSGVRELDLSRNEVKTLPAWIGDFTKLEVLKASDCALSTLAAEIARLPRLRKLELADNPITSLPFGVGAFGTVEILTIGDMGRPEAAKFTANLDLALFPWLRIIEQRYDTNTVEELDYSDTADLWNNPHLEVLNADWPAFKYGIPAGLLKAHNLQALATRVNAAQLGSTVVSLQALKHLEYLAIGYTDLSRAQLTKLYDNLPRVFISCQAIEGKSDWDFPEDKQLRAIEDKAGHGRIDESLAELDDLTGSLNLRRPLLTIGLHEKLLTLCVKIRRQAAEAERDKARRQALAEAAAKWADRVLSILPRNAEACWYLDYHKLWLARLQCLYAKATGLALSEKPDAKGAQAALDQAQAEIDRFLLPINSHWHSTESARVQTLRVRIPL
jgi:hypothetical protein